MDDGRCLLDVIGDPDALDEFLQNEERQRLNLFNEDAETQQVIHYPPHQQLLSPSDLILPQNTSYHQSFLSTPSNTIATQDSHAVSSTTEIDELAVGDSIRQQPVVGSNTSNPSGASSQTLYVQVQQRSSSHVLTTPTSTSTSSIPIATIKPYAATQALQALNSGSGVTSSIEDPGTQKSGQGQVVVSIAPGGTKTVSPAQSSGSTFHYLAPGSALIRNAAVQPVSLSGTVLQTVQSMTQAQPLGQNQTAGQPFQIIPSGQVIQQGGALQSGRVMTLGPIIIGGAPGQQITVLQAPAKTGQKAPAVQTVIAPQSQIIKGHANIQPKPAVGSSTGKTPISIRPVQIAIPQQTLQGGVPQNYQIISHPSLGQSVMIPTSQDQQQSQPQQVISQLLQPTPSTQQDSNNTTTQQQSFRYIQHPTSGQIIQIPTQVVQQGSAASSQQQQPQQSYRVVQQQSSGQPLQVAAGQQEVQQSYQVVNPTIGGQATLPKTIAQQVTQQPGSLTPQQTVVLQNQVFSNARTDRTSQIVHPVITIGTSQGNIIVMTQAQPVTTTTTTQSGSDVEAISVPSEGQTDKAKKSVRPSKKKKGPAAESPKTIVVERASPLSTPTQTIQRLPTILNSANPPSVALKRELTITPNAQGIPTMTVSQAGGHLTSGQVNQLSVTPQVTQSTYQISHGSVSVQNQQQDAKSQALLDADQQQFQLYQKVLKLQQEKQQAKQQALASQTEQQLQLQQKLQMLQQAQQTQLAQQQGQHTSQQLQAGQFSQSGGQALQQALQISKQQAHLSTQQVKTGQQVLQSGQTIQEQQQGSLSSTQQQAQQTVQQVMQSSQRAYTSQQQLHSLSQQGLQPQQSSTPVSQQQFSQLQIGQSAQPAQELSTTLQQTQQQQPQLQKPKPGAVRQMTMGQALQAIINRSGKGQQITSPQQLQQFIQANPHIIKLLQQKQQQQQQQQQQQNQSNQDATALQQPSLNQTNNQGQASSTLSPSLQNQGTSDLVNTNNNSDQVLSNSVPVAAQPTQGDQGFQTTPQEGVNTQTQHTFSGLGSAAIHLARLRQQKQQQQQQLLQQQQSSAVLIGQQTAAGSAVIQQNSNQVQLQQQQVLQGSMTSQQVNMTQPDQNQTLSQPESIQPQLVNQQQPQQGSFQTAQGHVFQTQTTQSVQPLTVQQQLQQQRQLGAAVAAMQTQQGNSQVSQVNNQGLQQVQGKAAQGSQVQGVMQTQGVQQQQQQQQPGVQHGETSTNTQLSNQASSARQQAVQQISINAQKQLQLIQNHIRQITSITNPTDSQKNMLTQLQTLQQKIVLQARQQLAQFLASGNLQQQSKPAAATTAVSATQQSPNLSQSAPSHILGQNQAVSTNQNLSQSLSINTAPQQQQQQQPQQQQQQQPSHQLASAVAIASQIQASLKGASQPGGASLTPQQKLLVRQLQENLKKMTPEQQQQFYKHQQALLMKMQAQARLGNQSTSAVQQQQGNQQLQGATPKKVIAIKPALPVKLASKEPPKEQPKPEKDKHKHKSKHKDKDKDREREKEKDRSPKKPKPTPMAKQLATDISSVEKTDTKKSFCVASKAIKRLLPFHLCQDNTPTDEQLAKSDETFEAKCTILMEKKQRMLNKYQLLLYNESMRLRPSAEVVMIERMFLSDERSKLEADKKLAAANKELIETDAPVLSPSTSDGITSSTALSTPSTETTVTSTSKVSHKMDTPILRELVTSPPVKMPPNLLSPKMAAALTESVAAKITPTGDSVDIEGGVTTVKVNGRMDLEALSNSENAGSLKNSEPMNGSPRLPPKKRKIDMSAYLVKSKSEEQVEDSQASTFHNHVKLKLKRMTVSESDSALLVKATQPALQPNVDIKPLIGLKVAKIGSNQKSFIMDRRPSFHDEFLKKFGLKAKEENMSLVLGREEVRENDSGVLQEGEDDDDNISVVDLQEQMECAINSILDLQRLENGAKQFVKGHQVVSAEARPVTIPSSQPAPFQELQGDSVSFDDQGGLTDLDFENHSNSIDYDLGNITEFPFDTDDQANFLPDQNADIFHTDISSSSYPPAPLANLIEPSSVQEQSVTEMDFNESNPEDSTSSSTEKQYPAVSEPASTNFQDSFDLPDESSVVAQFQNELSMLQHHNPEEDSESVDEYFSGGVATEAETETDPDLEAAVNSILF